MKEIIEVPVLSAAVRKIGVPLSLVTRGAGLVFVSGTPARSFVPVASWPMEFDIEIEAVAVSG